MQQQQVVPQLLQLNTVGSFRVLSVHDTSLRCGPHGVSRTIKYELQINSRPDLRDENGFVIDWRDVSRAIAKRYRNPRRFPSCELIAMQICDMVNTLMGGRCDSIQARVTIEGLPANMVARWERPTPAPANPDAARNL